MIKRMPVAIVCICCLLFAACSKKHVPQKETATTSENVVVDSAMVKAPVKKMAKPTVRKKPAAKVITVNELSAKKSVDGRLYYDVDGYRYWRNYDDGKYYLFNRAQATDPAFKPH